MAFLTRNDAADLATPEGVPLILASLLGLDTSNISVTDLASLIAQLQVADSALLSISESPPALSVVLTVADTLGVAGNEGVPAILVLLNRADALDAEALELLR